MSEVAIGLVGVIVGGLLTLAGSLLLERRRERRDELRARRLVADELLAISHDLGRVRDYGRAPMGADNLAGMFPMTRWGEHAAALAAVNAFEWHRTAALYRDVESFRRALLRRGGGALTKRDRDEAAAIAIQVLAAYDSLVLDPARHVAWELADARGEQTVEPGVGGLWEQNREQSGD